MQIIKTYYNFINERFEPSRTETKDLLEIVQIYKENCFDWDLESPNQIYRGSFAPKYYYINPKGKYRFSANASNVYNSLFDVLPSWDGVPKRSESLIMTTERYYASNFSKDNPHVMIPFNNTDIVMCFKDDIYNSSPFIDSLVDNEFYGFEGLDVELSDFFKQNLNLSDNRVKYAGYYLTYSPSNIRELCDRIDQIPKNEIKRKYSYSKHDYELVNYWLMEKREMRFFDFLNWCMDFKKNKFKIVTDQNQLAEGKEVWSNGEFIGMEYQMFEHFKNQL